MVTPIHVATTFIRDPDNQYRNGFIYGRPDNQTVRQCEAVLTASRRARGHAARLGDVGGDRPRHGPAGRRPHRRATVMYWALRNWLMNDATTYGYTTTFVDTADLAAVKAAVVPGKTKLVWLETPSNPLWTFPTSPRSPRSPMRRGPSARSDSTVATPC